MINRIVKEYLNADFWGVRDTISQIGIMEFRHGIKKQLANNPESVALDVERIGTASAARLASDIRKAYAD